MNTDLRPPDVDKFGVLAGSTQFEIPFGQQGVGEGSDYEVRGDPPEFERGAGCYLDHSDQYYDPPGTLIPDATASGYIYFRTAMDTTLDDISVKVNHNQVRATWE